MKKIKNLVMAALVAVSFTGCASVMKFDKTATVINPIVAEKSDSLMEFIGFNASNLPETPGDFMKLDFEINDSNYQFPKETEQWATFRKETVMKKFETALATNNIAYNNSLAKVDEFNQKELSSYQSKKRFLTFVEVTKNEIGGAVKDNSALAATVVAGTGLVVSSTFLPFALMPTFGEEGMGDYDGLVRGSRYASIGGAVLALAGTGLFLIPAKTELRFNGEYTIYVYDKEQKEIIYKDEIVVQEKDRFNGSYINDGTDRKSAVDYYATIVYNELLKKYAEADRFVINYAK